MTSAVSFKIVTSLNILRIMVRSLLLQVFLNTIIRTYQPYDYYAATINKFIISSSIYSS